MNVRFSTQIHRRLWDIIWKEHTSLPLKFVYLIFLIFFSSLIFLGLPFTLYHRLAKRPCKQA